MARGLGRGIMQIPNPAMHACVGRQGTERTQPVERNELLLQFLFRGLGSIGAGKFANELAASVENLESDGSRSAVGEIVINHHTIGRIGACWFVGWKRGVGVRVALNAEGGRRSKKMHVTRAG